MRTAALLIAFSAAAAAQTSSGYLYVAPGGATSSGETLTTIHAGAGLDAVIAKGVGANLEFGALGPRDDLWAGHVYAFSPGASYHFRRETEQRLDPFVAGGYTLFFRGHGSSIDHANGAYFGGGVNYWALRRVGLRLEFRDHINWDNRTVHFWGFRFGLALR